MNLLGAVLGLGMGPVLPCYLLASCYGSISISISSSSSCAGCCHFVFTVSVAR